MAMYAALWFSLGISFAFAIGCLVGVYGERYLR